MKVTHRNWKFSYIILCVLFVMSLPRSYGNEDAVLNDTEHNITSPTKAMDKEPQNIVPPTSPDKEESVAEGEDKDIIVEHMVSEATDLKKEEVEEVVITQPPKPLQPKPNEADFLKINYASKDKGADVLEYSEEAKGASSLIIKNKDMYCITPCEVKLFVVLQLSEDVRAISHSLPISCNNNNNNNDNDNSLILVTTPSLHTQI
jgi:hypothetical protein